MHTYIVGYGEDKSYFAHPFWVPPHQFCALQPWCCVAWCHIYVFVHRVV